MSEDKEKEAYVTSSVEVPPEISYDGPDSKTPKRGLQSRHLTMSAIAGVIGTVSDISPHDVIAYNGKRACFWQQGRVWQQPVR